MAHDREEAKVRGQQKQKYSKAEPFFKLEHRVIDSPAFADLSPSAIRLLLVMCRQLNGKNNGQLQATFSFASRYGIGSQHTLQDAIAQLVAHGFIYRTRSHGANGAWARYAVTWLPIQDKTDLFLAGFASCAWRNWEPSKGNIVAKIKKPHGKNCISLTAETAVSPPNILQKVQEGLLQKVQSMNNLPSSAVFRASSGIVYRPLVNPIAYRYKPLGRGYHRSHCHG